LQYQRAITVYGGMGMLLLNVVLMAGVIRLGVEIQGKVSSEKHTQAKNTATEIKK
jgi:hypothetical protein